MIREFLETARSSGRIEGTVQDAMRRIHIVPRRLTNDELPLLYKAATAMVMPTRGEGWGRPHVEAMAMGLPLIATNWSGPTAFMTPENSYPLRIDGLSVIPDGPFAGHRWAEPSVKHLRELLRRVVDHPHEAAAKGRVARLDMVAKFSVHRIAGDVVRQLLRTRSISTDHTDL